MGRELSPAQLDLLRHLAEGRKERTFAQQRGLKLNTVHQQKRRLFKRLGGQEAALALVQK